MSWMTAATVKNIPQYNDMITGWQKESDARKEKEKMQEVGGLVIDAMNEAGQMEPTQREQFMRKTMGGIHEKYNLSTDQWGRVNQMMTVVSDQGRKAKAEQQSDDLSAMRKEEHDYQVGRRGIPQTAYLNEEEVYPQNAAEWIKLQGKGATTQKPMTSSQSAEHDLRIGNLGKQDQLLDLQIAKAGQPKQPSPADIKLFAEQSLKTLGARLGSKGSPLVEGDNGELMTTVSVSPNARLGGSMTPSDDVIGLISQSGYDHSMGKPRKEGGGMLKEGTWVADIYLGGYRGGVSRRGSSGVIPVSYPGGGAQPGQGGERPSLDQIFKGGSTSGGMLPDAVGAANPSARQGQPGGASEINPELPKDMGQWNVQVMSQSGRRVPVAIVDGKAIPLTGEEHDLYKQYSSQQSDNRLGSAVDFFKKNMTGTQKLPEGFAQR